MSDVCKWGGSSLACGNRVLEVAKFIRQNNINVIVLSAPGKMTGLEDKITDLLIKASQNLNGFDYYFKQIEARFEEIIKILKISFDLRPELSKIKANFLATFDNSYLISRGEYLMAKIMARHLKYKFVDAKNIILFDKAGKIKEKTYTLIRQKIDKYQKVVLPGFYGGYNGKIKIFSRGGSDITGAIVAKALNKNYSNYTDIDGVYNTFPLQKSSKKLKVLSYKDMKFLGLFGFGVLHHKCCDILKDTNLKIFIKSTFEPFRRPTTIKSTNSQTFARASKKMALMQSKSDILSMLKKEKIFVYFRYTILDNYFYLIDKEAGQKLKGYTIKDITVTAFASSKPIKNALCLCKNHYLKIAYPK